MEESRVDVLTLANAAEAASVLERLQVSGIQAFLSGEEPIRVQVALKDEQTARAILGDGGSDTMAEPGPSPGSLMDRAFKAAVLGLVVWPIEFYAFGLLTKAFLEEKEGQSVEREKVMKTLIMSLPLVLLQVFLLWSLVTALLDLF